MILTIDTETSIYAVGNPFVPDNKLYCISFSNGAKFDCIPIEYGGLPYASGIETIQTLINSANSLIGFNIKFDLHWLRRYGITFNKCNIFDCQSAAFVLAAQRIPYPSLNDVALRYLDRSKLDIVNTEYWSKGIDTCDIPWDILSEYAIEDVILTEDLYYYFQAILDKPENKKLKTLISLQNQDLLALEEMEWNGMKYDFEKSKQKEEEADEKLKEIYEKLNTLVPGTNINWNSSNQLSCVLYGGTIVTPYRYPDGVYKTGASKGLIRYHWGKKETKMAQLVEPISRTKLKKEGYWSISSDVLKQLKPKAEAKQIISLLLEKANLEKLNSTYYSGIPKLAKTMGWKDGIIHGGYNQCTAVTGRLSSSRPNMQNFAEEIDELLISRY